MILTTKLAIGGAASIVSALYIELLALSDAVQLAYISAIVPTVAGLGAMLVGLKNGQKSNRNGEKLVEIHTLTNSNLTAVTSALEVANTKIAGLERMLQEIGKAQNVTNATLHTPIPVVIEQPKDLPVPVVLPPKTK